MHFVTIGFREIDLDKIVSIEPKTGQGMEISYNDGSKEIVANREAWDLMNAVEQSKKDQK